ncbi:MAG: FtsW/RodA/SpoVE family cell cycle protein, partial [Christensenellales bacterium]
MKKKINMKNIFIKSKKTNFWLVFCTILLVLIGFLFVYSASSYSAELNYSNKYYFLTKQVIGAVIGAFAMILTSKLDYKFYEKYKLPILILGVVLLAVVFIPGLGVSNYGAQRWIRLPGFTIQPSEISKFCFVIFSAGYLAKNKDAIKSFKGILPILVLGATYCVLIMLEPNMSITICVGLAMFVMLFIGGAE